MGHLNAHRLALTPVDIPASFTGAEIERRQPLSSIGTSRGHQPPGQHPRRPQVLGTHRLPLRRIDWEIPGQTA